jgi:hypothetical protein
MDKFDQKLTSGISLIQLRSKTILNTTFIAELYNNAAHPVISDVWHFTTLLGTQL